MRDVIHQVHGTFRPTYACSFARAQITGKSSNVDFRQPAINRIAHAGIEAVSLGVGIRRDHVYVSRRRLIVHVGIAPSDVVYPGGAWRPSPGSVEHLGD